MRLIIQHPNSYISAYEGHIVVYGPHMRAIYCIWPSYEGHIQYMALSFGSLPAGMKMI